MSHIHENVTASENRRSKTEVTYERPAVQHGLYSSCIKIKCYTVVCIKSSGSEVRLSFFGSKIDGAVFLILMYLYFPNGRYLSVRWSIDLPKVILFTGERGDTDYKDLLRGVHMTIVLRNSVVCGSEINGHGEGDFKNDDGIVSKDNMKVAVAEGFEDHDISKALDLLRRRCDS